MMNQEPARPETPGNSRIKEEGEDLAFMEQELNVEQESLRYQQMKLHMKILNLQNHQRIKFTMLESIQESMNEESLKGTPMVTPAKALDLDEAYRI